MILARSVFHAKYGRAKELVAMFQQMGDITDAQAQAMQLRILTDLSGPFDTVVLEAVHESLAALEQWRNAIFAEMDAAGGPNPLEDLVVSGYNEYFTIEVQA
jgi:hypothetical protein